MLTVVAEAALASELMKTPPSETVFPDPAGLNRVRWLRIPTTPPTFPMLKTYAGGDS